MTKDSSDKPVDPGTKTVASLSKGCAEENDDHFLFSSQAEKKLVRKIDLRILPLMTVAYMIQFLDKQTLSSAAIMGIQKDLHLVNEEYNWTSSIFYFGYLFFSYPASLLMVKFPLGKYLSITFIIWAAVLICHAGTSTFAGMMVARFFLGCAEASISPGFSLITSLWYRTSEQPLRHGLWFCGNSISVIFGSLIAIGILKIENKLAPWKWLFIIFGLVTLAWGLLMLFRLPDSPITTSFLTEEERIIATERLRANQTGYKTNKLDKAQFFEALTDYKTWMLALYALGSNIPNGGSSTFSPLVLYGFGYSTFRTFLLGMPIGAIMLAFVLLSAFLSSRIKNIRCICMAVVNCVSILGAILVYATKSTPSRYSGLLILGVSSAGLPLSLSMVASNVGGFTKRATVNAIIFIMYCVGNIIGPQLFFAREAPKYQSGFLSMIICFVVIVVDVLALALLLRRENIKRDRDAASDQRTGNGDMDDFADITDVQNKQFRYVY